MYIKIKHIKQFLLIAACFFLAGFNYLTYAKADSKSTGNTACDKSIDSDCDGLTNTEEKLYGTNANNIDTDGDGYSDGVEVRSGYDPLKAAPGDRIETGANTAALPNQNSASIDSGSSLTDDYLQNLTSYLSSKNSQSISTTDINNFTDEQLAKNMGDPITLDTLPELDRSQIKILKQNYSALSDADRKKREINDATRYFEQILYLLINNAPNQLATPADFSAFYDDFLSHLANLSSSNEEDLAYFSDLGNRLGVFLTQVNDVQVPETLVDFHVKILRILKGVLTLENFSADPNDPLGRMLLLSKATAYTNLVSNFFQNDFRNYFERLSTS